MKKKENEQVDDLLRKISSDVAAEQKAQEEFDYAGYGLLDKMVDAGKLTKDDIKKAVTIMWDICMELDKDSRDQTYLFGKGLIKSKDIFLSQFNRPDVELPQEKVDKFRHKLENIKPLVDFLVKIKDVL